MSDAPERIWVNMDNYEAYKYGSIDKLTKLAGFYQSEWDTVYEYIRKDIADKKLQAVLERKTLQHLKYYQELASRCAKQIQDATKNIREVWEKWVVPEADFNFPRTYDHDNAKKITDFMNDVLKAMRADLEGKQ